VVRFQEGDSTITLTFAAKWAGVNLGNDAAILSAGGGLFDLGWFAEFQVTPPPVAFNAVGHSSIQKVTLNRWNLGHHLFVMRRQAPAWFPLKGGGLVGVPFIVRL
jgi:hypothetical protein